MNTGALRGFVDFEGGYNPIPRGGSWAGNRGRISVDEFRLFGYPDNSRSASFGYGSAKMINTNSQASASSIFYPGDLGSIVNALDGNIVMQGGNISAVYNSAGRVRQGNQGGGLSSIFENNTIVENVPGVAVSALVAPVSFEGAQTVVANGAACTVATSGGTTLNSVSQGIFGTSNGGTLAVSQYANFSAAVTCNSGATITTRIGYQVDDISNSALVPWLLTAGAGTVTNQYGVDIPILTGAGTVNTAIRIGAGGQTLTATPSPQIDFWQGTTTLNFANASANSFINASGTLALSQSGFGFGLMNLFTSGMTYKNTAGQTANITGVIGFNSTPVFQADTQNIAGGAQVGFRSAPTFNRINAGTITTGTTHVGFTSAATVSTGATVDTVTHFQAVAATVTGTLTTQIGLDIPILTGTTKIGIRNASTTANTPSTAQVLGAGFTVLANATTVQCTSAGAVTGTVVAAIIVAGTSGQVVTIVNANTTLANTMIFTSGTTENLSLGAATRTVGAGGSLTLVYNSTFGRWVEVGFNVGGN